MTKKSRNILFDQVVEALESIRPYLKEDGGDLEVVDVTEDKVVLVKLLGACESCSMNFMTMKAGIEQTIMNAVPEIKAVESV